METDLQEPEAIETPVLSALDRKINERFPGMVVRKDLANAVKGNASVPTYVLEYLLGQYCATSDEASIRAGIESVRNILRDHFVHRGEAGLVRSRIRERGHLRVIDKISVELNEKRDIYEADFSNLGIKDVLIPSETVNRHKKLLVSGIWCICELEYQYSEDRGSSPWIINLLKPIQLSNFDFDAFVEARRQFTTDEWIDLLVQSMGFDPEYFGRRSKLFQITRLIPYCERNYNLIELGPKGTGKSHIYSEFSPHGILLSGGEVSVPKLFVNNSTGRIGLVGFWDTIAFDEFAGKSKTANKALVDILKNYMANKTFSRGIETLGADASLAFVGNTSHNVAWILRHSDLFDDLPAQYHDSAFLDRLHFYIPGWEVDIIRGEMFSNGYGFVVDYLAEILRHMRNEDHSQLYHEHFDLSSDLSTRDRTGIEKTFSGLSKILFPHREATREETEELLRFAMEGRKRVKDQLMRIDSTYSQVRFAYADKGGITQEVDTLESVQYPTTIVQPRDSEAAAATSDLPQGSSVAPAAASHSVSATEGGITTESQRAPESQTVPEQQTVPEPPIAETPSVPDIPQHIVFRENQRGITFDSLFAPCLKGARSVVVTDAYVRSFAQVKNLVELLEVIASRSESDEGVKVHLLTSMDDKQPSEQREFLERARESAEAMDVTFTFEIAPASKIHARHIITDTGWKITIDRGLDIFQTYRAKDAYSPQNLSQRYRAVKAFEVTYLKEGR